MKKLHDNCNTSYEISNFYNNFCTINVTTFFKINVIVFKECVRKDDY
jgi:hypothetical protein